MSKPTHSRDWLVRRRYPLYAVMAVNLLIGFVYLGVQYTRLREIVDAPFVGLLMANSLLIVTALRRLYLYLRREEATLRERPFVHQMFNSWAMIPCGLAYGLLFGSAPHLVEVTTTDPQVHLWLCLFLGSHNVLAGMGIFCLVMYFQYAFRLARDIEIDLWNRSAPGLEILAAATRRIVVFVAVIACIAMTSALFSVFELGVEIVGFSLFSLLLILGSYGIPHLPINRRIRHVKNTRLAELGALLQAEYDHQLEHIQASPKKFSLQRFDALSELHKRASGVPLFFTWNFQVVKTGLWVVFLAILPSFLDFILKRLD